ncbi:MAG TPA: hypothetical protein VIJ46_07300 [Rhabdochlamydiaceae bacterium]
MNALGQFSSGLVQGAYSLLSRAASYVYAQAEKQVPLFDGSTLPKSVFTRVGAMLEKLESGDTEHLLKRSLNPHYEIPDPVVIRLKSSGIMDEVSGELDPQAVKVAENVELAVFHAFGSGGRAAMGAEMCAQYYRSQQMTASQEGQTEDVKKGWDNRASVAEKAAQAQYIRTYAEMAAYEEQKK